MVLPAGPVDRAVWARVVPGRQADRARQAGRAAATVVDAAGAAESKRRLSSNFWIWNYSRSILLKGIRAAAAAVRLHRVVREHPVGLGRQVPAAWGCPEWVARPKTTRMLLTILISAMMKT